MSSVGNLIHWEWMAGEVEIHKYRVLLCGGYSYDSTSINKLRLTPFDVRSTKVIKVTVT